MKKVNYLNAGINNLKDLLCQNFMFMLILEVKILLQVN
jgi:hypothetical protein